MSTFFEFAISPTLGNALKKLGYVEPSPVQSRVIPKALQGKCLVCQSETGSGKTHAYLIPILEKTDVNLPRLQNIVICPTRELARQVYDFAVALGKSFPKFKVRLFASDTDVSQNKEGVSVPPHLIIGTPGRLKALLSTDYDFDLHGVKRVVLDEADMFLELGYFDDVDELYSKLPEEVQTMVFSATLTEALKQRLQTYIGADFLYEGEKSKTSRGVNHHLVDIKHCGANEALLRFLGIRRPYFALVFASKKETVKACYDFLRENGHKPLLYSGDLDQRERKQALRKLKSNEVELVICSDLLSRGIDLEDVSDVISLDLPSDLAYYYHRAGRTGRFGKTGDSWVFYNADSTSRPKDLLRQGVAFDYYELKKDKLAPDPVGLAKKKKLDAKKPFSEEERRDVKRALVESRSTEVKPGYKKKQERAVERVKNKYRRKAIQKSIKAKKDARYAARARRKLEGKE